MMEQKVVRSCVMKHLPFLNNDRIAYADICVDDMGAYLYAHSDQIPGLHVAGLDYGELIPKIGTAMYLLDKFNEEDWG